MIPIDDTLDGIVLRWPQPAPQPKRQPIRQRLEWLSFTIWLVRLCAECLGWVALVGIASML